MLLTALHPDPRRGTGLVSTDVEAQRGLPLARLRPELARITGWPGWSSGTVRLAVDDAVLDDTHRVGAYPLVAGCELRPGPGHRPEAESAVGAALHVAVVAGPDCGRLHPVAPGTETTVRGPRSAGAPATDGDELLLADPDLGRVRVRCAGGRVRVRVDRPATLARAAPRWWRRGRRPVAVRRRTWVRWRPDDDLRVGATTLALRSRSGPATRPTAAGRPPGRATGPAAAMVLAPLVGSVALALALHQPLLLLTAATGPLLLLTGGRDARSVDAPDGSPLDPSDADDPAHLVAATVLALDGGPVVHRRAPWDADGALAVVGPRGTALAVARGLVLGELGTHARPSLSVLADDPEPWAWAAALARPVVDAGPGVEDHVVVVDRTRVTDETATRRSTAGPGQRMLLVLPSRDQVPAWCRHVLQVGPTSARLRGGTDAPLPDALVPDTPARGTARSRRGVPDGDGWRAVPLHAVSSDTARAQVARACGVRELRGRLDPGPLGGPLDPLPSQVPLAGLPDLPAADAPSVATAWGSPRAGLAAPLGRTSGLVPVEVDLVADGPHALVAGTTGAGKSELLTTWVLATALRHPPERLAVLLVDFKGGAGLGAVAGLPHVVDHVTDLDATRARRVLTGLRAELRRRERLLADHAARDVADLDRDDAATPPRLLVVVDELRALVDDLPDATATLVRLAAQGRALGVHLLLATQRPAGAVSADLRANTSLRIALRVADPADSLDVVEVPDAALLPPSTPGRAVLRRAGGAPELLQVARPGGRVDEDAGVRLARPSRPSEPWTPQVAACSADDEVAAWVTAARRAAVGRPVRPVPWVPALPEQVTVEDVAPGPGLALAVADVPDEQRRAPVRWDPADGHLLVLGGPGSGRTTTLLTLGTEALRDGLPVHAVGLPARAVAELRARDPLGLVGTVARSDEPVRVARLAELLGSHPGPDDGAGPRAVLLVDDLTTTLDALAVLARGAGPDRLTRLWRSGGSAGGVAVVATADVTGGAVRHGTHFRDRLVLRVPDISLDAVAGVPGALSGARAEPGRAIHVGPAGAVVCQVALPATTVPRAPRRPPGTTVRVEALPRRATRPAERHAPAGEMPGGEMPGGELPGAGGVPAAGGVPLGVGGDDASPVRVDVDPGLLVAGPPGSGRSTTLGVVADGLVRAGVPVVRLVDLACGPVVALPGVVDVDVSRGDARSVLDGPGRRTVLVDDLDDLERAYPDLVDAWARWSGAGCVFVAATTSSAAVGAYRGLVPTLLRLRRAVVLDVHDAASAELVGGRAAWLADPADRPAGRGVLVVGRTATPVQVYAPDRAGSTAGPEPSS
ncbi:hypothetical protein Cch01nite_36120 [Cellulomonas chitinilytica]|uniref:FtsK domain-containing protein n=1 Tax=Cellulomonas chitinilytica TaxID=398759 RepID=A0A919P6J5_9CELL|nr:FtsK/SpoIIIE domain-containing protein [Cellulomonas chitinilytica]GIG22888.1 hypothetical protein Cch01nite_36120 [Cellulomonas chitinilytica]